MIIVADDIWHLGLSCVYKRPYNHTPENVNTTKENRQAVVV